MPDSFEAEQGPSDEIDHRISEVDERYQFTADMPSFPHAETLKQDNLLFLAMLDEYASKAGVILPDREPLYALDFGAGMMPYQGAYKAFAERYGKPHGEKRQMKITAWESDRDIPVGGSKVNWISTHLKDRKGAERMLEVAKIPEIHLLTMFGCGPSSHITHPEVVEKSYRSAIAALAPSLSEDGIFIATSSFGGLKKGNLRRYMEESGLEVILDEPNKYEKKMKLGFSHLDIIIARKRKTQ